MADIKKLAEQLVGLTVKEVTELEKELKETHGIAAAPVMATAAAAPQAGAEAAKEKSSYNVVLKEIGGKKLVIYKNVREITGLAIKEAKALVDSAPGAVIKEGVKKEEAEALKKQLEDQGATVELQ